MTGRPGAPATFNRCGLLPEIAGINAQSPGRLAPEIRRLVGACTFESINATRACRGPPARLRLILLGEHPIERESRRDRAARGPASASRPSARSNCRGRGRLAAPRPGAAGLPAAEPDAGSTSSAASDGLGDIEQLLGAARRFLAGRSASKKRIASSA